ncbi:MAG TPA: hypothetical protein ENJ37_06400 [Deltaproteobacteria bacterium]|nr:hypothetical protein [Deltaproteobacteria bacterium]
MAATAGTYRRQQRRSAAGAALKALVLYAILASVVYGPVVLGGATLVAPLYQPPALSLHAAGEEERRPAPTFNVDTATPTWYESPVNSLAGRIYRSADLPLWNPHQGGGTPLAAQYSTRVFFPYQVVEDLSPPTLWDRFIVGRMVLAGFFTFLFLSRLGLCAASAFTGGVAYMFSGVFVWFPALEQFTNAAMVLPLVMLFVESLAAGTYRRAGIPAAALAFALMHLAGQPEVTLYATLLAFLYFLARAFSLHGAGGWRRCVHFAAAYALGLAAAAVLLVPFFELVVWSRHIHPAGGLMGLQALVNRMSLMAVFVPGATELPVRVPASLPCGFVESGGGLYRYLPVNGVWDLLGGFVGAAAPMLALTGVAAAVMDRRAPHRGLTAFFFLFTISIMLKNLGVEPWRSLGALPLFDQAWSLRWAGPAWVFSAACSAALGLEAAAAARRRRGGLRYGPAVAALVVATLLYALWPLRTAAALAAVGGDIFDAAAARYVVPAVVGSTVVAAAAIFAIYACVSRYVTRGRGLWAAPAVLAAEAWWSVPRGYDADWLALKGLLALAAALVVVMVARERYGAAAAATLAFLAAFLAFDAASPGGMPQRRDPFAAPPYVGFLREEAGVSRVVGAYGVLMPNTASALGLYDLHYANALVPRSTHDLRERFLRVPLENEEPVTSLWFVGMPGRCVGSSSGGGFTYRGVQRPVELDWLHGLDVYSFFGVRYFAVPAGLDLNARLASLPGGGPVRRFPLVHDGRVRVYENPAALERAFVVYAYEVVSGGGREARERAFSGGFDPGRGAVLEKAPPLESRVVFPAFIEAPAARITSYEPRRVVVEVTTPLEGLLVLTDTWYPGWRARVNGVETEIFRVDGAVRGVVVPAGRSTVEFHYLPATFIVGLAVSALSLAAMVIVAVKGGGRLPEEGARTGPPPGAPSNGQAARPYCLT